MERMVSRAHRSSQELLLVASSFPASTSPHVVIGRVFAKICFPDNNSENRQEINTLRNNRGNLHLVVKWKTAEELIQRQHGKALSLALLPVMGT